jgi:hypothetical protein
VSDWTNAILSRGKPAALEERIPEPISSDTARNLAIDALRQERFG